MNKEVCFFKNFNKGKEGWSDRNHFACMKYSFSYEKDKDFIDEIVKKAKDMSKRVNSGGANNSEKRDENIKLIDCVSGFLAEAVCFDFYSEYLGEEKVVQDDSTSSFHQIDLKTIDGKDIEVRSSFVFGFPNVPLFRLNKNPSFDGHSAYNIPCTYTNGYKSIDFSKDYYTLVAFVSEKNDFLKDIYSSFDLYITGTATKDIVKDVGGEASLKTANKTTKVKTSYKIVPIHKSLDVTELKKCL